jgi:hypothetical protein
VIPLGEVCTLNSTCVVNSFCSAPYTRFALMKAWSGLFHPKRRQVHRF